MCDHRQHVSRIERRQVTASTPPENTCNIYYIHQDGSMFWEQNVAFNSSEECLPCGEDRLTLIQLPASQIPPETESSKDFWLDSYPSPTMPSMFEAMLKKLCPHCLCNGKTAWRNIHRPNSHFDTRFRFVDDVKHPENRCFLTLYTMRVPLMAKITVAISIIHHIRVEGGKLISANGAQGENKEQIFGFVTGFDSMDIGILFTNLVSQWQDPVGDHLKTCSGMTPVLFMAATISQYSSVVSQDIIRLQGRNLYEDSQQSLGPIHEKNEKLMDMNMIINKTGPVFHYLANINDTLAGTLSRFKEYMEACVQMWDGCPHQQDLLKALQQLDSIHELARDKNQLELVAKSVSQCQEEARNLLQQIIVVFEAIRGISAERDRTIQTWILDNTARDGRTMRLLAILTAIFLPGTFMAILLTTPMFNWVDTENSTLVKVPFEIWMGFTGSVTVLLIIGVALKNWARIWRKIRSASYGLLVKLTKRRGTARGILED